MKRLRAASRVDRVLKTARREIKGALKELNHLAGKLMARGHYGAATDMAGLGRTISDFEGRIDTLRREWLTLWRPKQDGGAKAATTPLWEYYQLVLQSLDALGGSGSRREIEQTLEAHAIAKLKPGDLKSTGKRGVPRWKLMLRRARKQMAREKYLEDGKGKLWTITPLGRQVAHGDARVPSSG